MILLHTCITYVYNIMYGIILTYIYIHIHSYLCYDIDYITYHCEIYDLTIVRSRDLTILLIIISSVDHHQQSHLTRILDFVIRGPQIIVSSPPPPHTLLSLYSFNNCQVQKEVIFTSFLRVFPRIMGFGDLEI
jgi:hypothetical protein